MLCTSLRLSAVLVLLAAVACVPGGDASEGRSNGPVAEAAGPMEGTSSSISDVPVEALGSLEKVYVPILGKSMASLDDALEEKGYGNVKGSDFKPQFEYADTGFGPALVAYSSGDWMDSHSFFLPMSVTQWLEAALSDDEAHGAVINPGHPGQILALTKQEIEETMGWLPKQPPLPMEIYIAQ
jgi:hypothetical protein